MIKFAFVRSALARPVTFWRGLGAVAVTVAAASLLRWMFGSAADPVPFVTYFPAIILCTLFAGWQAGIASIFASMAVVDLLFMKPHLRPSTDLKTAGMMALFVGSCLLLVAIAQALRRTFGELNAASERAEFLNQELLHRVRNSLTVVSSLATQTFRANPENFPAVFSQRISALAGGLDVLTKDVNTSVDLRAVINNAVRPFLHEDCIVITGATAAIPVDACIPLTLALHELCTNAVKYGALSVSGGAVRIQLRNDDGKIVLTWQESGGPAVCPPARTGLGSILLQHTKLGPARTEFLTDGLRCEMVLMTAS